MEGGRYKSNAGGIEIYESPNAGGKFIKKYLVFKASDGFLVFARYFESDGAAHFDVSRNIDDQLEIN
jgi:hypothetical protein